MGERFNQRQDALWEQLRFSRYSMSAKVRDLGHPFCLGQYLWPEFKVLEMAVPSTIGV